MNDQDLLKVYQMNEKYYWADYSLEEAIKNFTKIVQQKIVNAKKLSIEELENNWISLAQNWRNLEPGKYRFSFMLDYINNNFKHIQIFAVNL